MVYIASKRRKHTPKHVGLGLSLHHATRSEKMVNIFHAAGHTVGIDTIRRIDSSIANDILRRYEQNGYKYIPTRISPYTPGRIILSSFDNIDVLKEAIDGKNTLLIMCFAAMWATVTTRTTVKTRRSRIPDQKQLEKFHTIDIAPVYTGARPNPIVTSRIEPEIWDMGNGCQAISNLSNQAWIYWLVCTTKMNKMFHHGQLSMLHVVFLKQQ